MGVNTNNAIHTHPRVYKRGGNAEVSVYQPYRGAWRSALHPHGDDHTTTRGYYRGYIRKTAFAPRSSKMLTNFKFQDLNILNMEVIITGSLETRKTSLTTKWTGWTADIFVAQAACATSRDVTGKTSTPQLLMDGFGLVQE